MRKIFLAPRSNETAYKNYISSMQGRAREEVLPSLSVEDAQKLGPDERFFIWGCQPSLKSRWSALELGDYIIFYARGKFISVGELKFKTINEDLALKLWPPNKETHEPWSCLFFVDNIRELDVPIERFKKMTGYKFDRVQGFMRVTEGYLDTIESKYGSAEKFVSALELNFDDAELRELAQILEGPSKNISKEEISRLDQLTRTRSDEEIEAALEQYARNAQGKTPEQIARTNKAYKRDKGIVRNMKMKYRDKCQICGFTFKTAKGAFYSEAAHVIPISSGIAGVDSPDNIWILCANHHKMLDLGAIEAISRNEYREDGLVKKLLSS